MEYLSYIILVTGLSLSVKTFVTQTGHQGANRYLAAFLFCCAFLFFFSFHFFYCDSFWITFLSTLGFIQFYFLIGPFSFFYIRGTLRDNARIKPIELLHFAPFVLLMLNMVPYYLVPLEKKLEIAHILHDRKWDEFLLLRHKYTLPFIYADSLRLLSISLYGIAQWVLIWKFRRQVKLKGQRLEQYVLVRRWLVIFAGIFSIFVVQRIIIGGLILFIPMNATLENTAEIFCLSMSVVYVVMNFGIFLFQNLLYGLIGMPIEVADQDQVLQKDRHLLPIAESIENEVRPAWINSLFQHEYVEEIERLLAQWAGEKKYLEKASLSDLSEDTGIPSHHLTYYFNSILGIKFTDWRNTQRIGLAKLLIDEGMMDTLKLDGVAEKCGFNSRATFFRVFKEISGVTPLEYLKSSKESR